MYCVSLCHKNLHIYQNTGTSLVGVVRVVVVIKPNCFKLCFILEKKKWYNLHKHIKNKMTTVMYITMVYIFCIYTFIYLL